MSESLYAQAVTWQKVFPTPQPDYGRDGIQTLDGGYIIIAINQSAKGTAKLLKLDLYGNEEWTRIIDSQGTAVSIKQTADSNFIIAGDGNSKGLLIKTDKFGNLIWKKYYTINNELAGFTKVKLLNNGDYLFCGVISFPAKAYIVRTDTSGAVVWERSFSNGFYDAFLYDITEADDGKIYFTGFTIVEGVGKTLFGKVSNEGNLIWLNSYGSVGKGDGQLGKGIIFENNSSIYISGNKRIFFSNRGHFMKIDSSGNFIFQKNYNSADEFISMSKFNSGYALCGSNGNVNKINLITVDNDGNELMNRFYSFNSINEITYAHSLSLTHNNGFFITGLTTYQGSDMNLNIICIKTDSLGNATVTIINENKIVPKEYKLHQNYPNPFNSQTKIKFEIMKNIYVELSLYNIAGNKISEIVNGYYNEGTYNVLLNLNFLPSGIYFYRMQSDKFFEVKKMILQK